MFFHRCSCKNSCFSELGVQLQCPCANLMIFSLRFKKDVLILKVLLSILCFLFWNYTHESYYFTFIEDKNQHGLIITLFPVQPVQLFWPRRSSTSNKLFFHCYSLIYFGYSANYRAFYIMFLVCSALLNFPRSVYSIVITTENR